MKTTRAMKRKAKPVERRIWRNGIEVTKGLEKSAKANVERFQGLKTIARMMLLIANGWMPTELGLWMRRTKWATGSITETYNFKTACEKQFGPGETTKPKREGLSSNPAPVESAKHSRSINFSKKGKS